MVLRAAFVIGHDPLEHFEKLQHFHIEIGLFQDLAADARFQMLSRFQDAAGQRPPSLQRFMTSFDQKDPIVEKHQTTDAEKWTRRITTVVAIVIFQG